MGFSRRNGGSGRHCLFDGNACSVFGKLSFYRRGKPSTCCCRKANDRNSGCRKGYVARREGQAR